MSDWQPSLQRIREKLQQLLKEHAALQREKGRLQDELEGLRSAHQHSQQQLEQLQRQVDVLKLNAGELKEPDKKELEKRIDHYLKEIDRCIALLGE